MDDFGKTTTKPSENGRTHSQHQGDFASGAFSLADWKVIETIQFTIRANAPKLAIQASENRPT